MQSAFYVIILRFILWAGRTPFLNYTLDSLPAGGLLTWVLGR
jgi:hypothetical protein